MGATNSYHKRRNECFGLNHPDKMPRFSSSSKAMASRISCLPETMSRLRREGHGPSRTSRFELASRARWRQRETYTFNAFTYSTTDKEVIVVEDDDETENLVLISDDSSSEDRELEGDVSLNSTATADMWRFEAYNELLGRAKKQVSRLNELGFSILFKKGCEALLQHLLPLWKQAERPFKESREPFIPLSNEEKAIVNRAFLADSRQILVTHETSNIDITGQALRCLKPGEWLNDEVINLFLALLKEREAREPKKFLKCHFFNTFFYNKLVSAETGYNYNAVRRWTSVKRLGYCLIDCDKIFIPTHMNNHWTLAVINKKDKKFQYLDSFKGRQPLVLNTLARYFVDEVKAKSGEDIDTSSWKQEFVEDLPLQKNRYNCGMFMLKYIDFYSRGLDLCFSQEHMPYFRVRTGKEILQLRAD